MTDAVAGTPVTSANGNNQTNTSLSAAYPAAAVDTLMLMLISGDASGTGVAPTGMAAAGWTKLGDVVDTNVGTASSSSYLAAFTRVLPAGSASGSSSFTWTNAGQMNSICIPFTGYDTTTPAVWQVGQEKTTSDGVYTVAGTTSAAGMLVTAFANRTGSTAWSGLSDTALTSVIVGTSGCTLVARITGASVASGAAFTRTATGTVTSVGTAAAVIVRGASGVTGAATLTGDGTLTAGGAPAAPGAAALSGTGSLSAGGSGTPSGTAVFSGAGSLTAGGSGPSIAGTAALSGTGVLTASGRTAITVALRSGTAWVAHRGGYASTLGEGTLEAYAATAAQYARALLEVSVWRCSTGEYVVSHDRTTGRVFSGTSVDITTTSWAGLSGKTTLIGGNPIRRLTDILAAFPTRLFVVDNKQDTNASTLIGVLDSYAAGRWMGKQIYTAAGTWLTACQNAGAPVWAYFYPTDLGSLSSTLASLSAAKSLIVFGLGDFSTAPVPVQSDSTTFHTFIAANGLMSWAHILGTTGQRTAADSQAATAGRAFDGYMVSAFASLAPADGGQAGLSGAGALTATAVAQLPGSASLTGAGTLTAAPGGVQVAGAAVLGGAGALTAAGRPELPGSAALSGSGALTATPAPHLAAGAALEGAGALSAAGAGQTPGSAALAGSGTLSALAGVSLVGAAQLSGQGTLITAAAPALSGTAALAGAGALAAAARPGAVAGAGLSGLGVLAATATGHLTGGVELAGTGELTATGQAVAGEHAASPQVTAVVGSPVVVRSLDAPAVRIMTTVDSAPSVSVAVSVT